MDEKFVITQTKKGIVYHQGIVIAKPLPLPSELSYDSNKLLVINDYVKNKVDRKRLEELENMEKSKESKDSKIHLTTKELKELRELKSLMKKVEENIPIFYNLETHGLIFKEKLDNLAPNASNASNVPDTQCKYRFLLNHATVRFIEGNIDKCSVEVRYALEDYYRFQQVSS